jgi:preprotein translocase subunit YajC
VTPATLLPLVLLAAVFYFLIVRPAKRRQAEQRATVSQLEPGRQVMTTGGLFGTVTAIIDDRVEIEIAPGVRVRYLAGAISKVVPVEASGEERHSDPESLPDAIIDPDSPASPRSDGDDTGR